ncbi:diguanylate cyclase [Gilvimarinus sp. F26214L]|uniref:diguanylate cyclase n=1 Tax=Gilvimarinus sp. DZF01 TaxID=3461371 RepID=UPI0040468306
MKILLVEDSATLRFTMCAYIQHAGHEPLVAESGEQAVQLIETTPVDLVIMDVEMPGLDGFETTRLIREVLGERWVPIIFVTGMGDEASYQQGIEAGGDDYMIKPVSPAILQAKLRAMARIISMQKQLQQLNARLQALSQRDGLTELFNRRTYEDKARSQWHISTRAHEPVAVLMIDVDHFKEYNDYYGHQAGDTCLQQVAAALSAALHRPADILARYGGEEFIVFLPGTSRAGARTVAHSLRSAVKSLAIPHASSQSADVVTVSIGAAVTDRTTGLSEQELAREADNALYRAKAKGRDRVELKHISPHRTLLILDSDAETLGAISELLRAHYNIITATSPDECLEIAHNCHPDMVVLGGCTDDQIRDIILDSLDNSQHTAGMPMIQHRGENEEDLLEEIRGYFS